MQNEFAPREVSKIPLGALTNIINEPYNKTCIILQYIAVKQSMNNAILKRKTKVIVHSKPCPIQTP